MPALSQPIAAVSISIMTVPVTSMVAVTATTMVSTIPLRLLQFFMIMFIAASIALRRGNPPYSPVLTI